jgi:LuxR family maltose regulon positive regulatory protein
MNPSIPVENQLLATKFYIPVALGRLILRPRLMALLNGSLKRPFTLVSAPAGFGKTTLLSTWSQSLPANNPRVAWVSLDEEDNNPQLFWTYVLTALQRQEPEQFTSLVMQLQSPQAPPLKYLLAKLINMLVEGTDHFLLILDDYQVITEQQVHTTLAYLIENLPPQLRIIVATRADPPLSLALLRAHQQALEVRTDQLRCTVEETKAFFQEVMGIQLSEETVGEVTNRTEGWLVGLQLLALSLPERADSVTLLKEVSGDQHYILDYLTEEVLRRQPQDIQTFLLSTCILERLNASLCDAVMDQANSQQILQRLEKANLFVVSLDSKREWYRYHALFAQALRHQLEQTDADLVLALHYRASLWYAQHDFPTEAILHALHAQQWQWAADLIDKQAVRWVHYDQKILITWLKRLPTEVIRARPRLCLLSAKLLSFIGPYAAVNSWLQDAEATLRNWLSALKGEMNDSLLREKREQENLLGEVLAYRAFIASILHSDESVTLAASREARTLLADQNFEARSEASHAQSLAHYSRGEAMKAYKYEMEASALARKLGSTSMIVYYMSGVSQQLLLLGRLHEAWRILQQTFQLEGEQREFQPQFICWAYICQAEILREWNQLDDALENALQGIKFGEQTGYTTFLCLGYTVQMRIHLARAELDAAQTAMWQAELAIKQLNSPYLRAQLALIDRVSLWLARGELENAVHWARELVQSERSSSLLVREREETARVRVLLAQQCPDEALELLGPLLTSAIKTERRDHVIETQLLQALAYQMCHKETQALSALSEAVHLAEPEGYIRRFVDEGISMVALLSQLHEERHQQGPTFYLDTLLAAFLQQNQTQEQSSMRATVHTPDQLLPDPLSEREREVLQALARGASNQQIAQELVITVDTVKRHVSHIFAKLGVKNRIQAVKQARELGLVDDEL